MLDKNASDTKTLNCCGTVSVASCRVAGAAKRICYGHVLQHVLGLGSLSGRNGRCPPQTFPL